MKIKKKTIKNKGVKHSQCIYYNFLFFMNWIVLFIDFKIIFTPIPINLRNFSHEKAYYALLFKKTLPRGIQKKLSSLTGDMMVIKAKFKFNNATSTKSEISRELIMHNLSTKRCVNISIFLLSTNTKPAEAYHSFDLLYVVNGINYTK